MPGTNFSPSILSRPVYSGFEPLDSGLALMVADADGAEALIELATRDASIMSRAHLIFIPKGTAHGTSLKALKPKVYREGPSYAAILPQLKKALADAHMSTRLYIAGTEGLIGQVTAEALAAGLLAEAIQTDHRGSIARRVQCVHCKGVTEDVATDPFACSHCGLTLFVRDHFSRRLGAFQGVCVDAETPGIVPETQEIQP